MELENIILSEVGFRRPKVTCSPSYADYRPIRNAAILWDTSHTKERLHTGGIRQGRKPKT
jgi:hypothetical protein